MRGIYQSYAKEMVVIYFFKQNRKMKNSKKFENHAMLENDYRFEIKLPLVSTLPTGSAYKVSAREQLTSLRYDFFYFSKMRYVAQINKFFRFSFDDSFSLVCKDIFSRFFLWTVYWMYCIVGYNLFPLLIAWRVGWGIFRFFLY